MATPNPSPNIGSASTNSVIEDPSSPYFLHHSDNPSTILVTHLLSGPNYNTWARSVVMALTAKNKLGFADDSIKPPILTDSLSSAWIRCNSLVTSWLLNAVTKDIADSLIYFNTASAIGKIFMVGFMKGMVHVYFNLKNSSFLWFKVLLMSTPTTFVSKLFGMSFKNISRFPNAHVRAYNPGLPFISLTLSSNFSWDSMTLSLTLVAKFY